MAKKFKKFFKWAFKWHKKQLKKYNECLIVDSFPKGELFKNDTIYYLERIKMVRFSCPCGCGNRESLPIEEKFNRNKKVWEIKVKDGKATIKASVGSAFPCHSHYFITDNKVEWCD